MTRAERAKMNIMILMMLLVSLCVIVTLFVFIRNICGRMDVMAKGAKRMADGHLDTTVPVDGCAGIGMLGQHINDLATNLQEVLLHVWNHTAHSMTLLDRISETIGSQPDCSIRQDVKFVRQNLENMQAVVRAFDLYDVRVDEGRLVASKKPAVEKGGECHD